uniref:Uncharacterized protein n=1 Tax=uncultured Alphaproteobacteria bacterium TaxID=91750 RepID=A0A6G8F340_9PROT|nr:hypothetical protein PlAlph_6120 [uncultured Alphaproteobacteria bacterium]
MIQKKKNLANEWHLFTNAAVEKISKYVAAHGISDELRSQLTGRKVGKVKCLFADGKTTVVTKSRSHQRRLTLERAAARAAKAYILPANVEPEVDEMDCHIA